MSKTASTSAAVRHTRFDPCRIWIPSHGRLWSDSHKLTSLGLHGYGAVLILSGLAGDLVRLR